MKLSYAVCGLCSLFFLEFLLAADDQQCTFWNDLATNLSHASKENGGAVRLACNSSCSQNSITCSGHFKPPTMVPVSYEFDFCMGLRLNHCDNPVTMDYYLDAPDVNISRSGSITHNSSLDIPGPTVRGFDSTIVIIVEMVRVNSTHVLFGVNAELRVSIGGIAQFPLGEKVFPPTYIDIPPCSQKPKTKPPFTSPAVCVAPPTAIPTPITSPTKKAGSTPKPVVHSKTYNKPCEIGLLKCGQNEMCKATINMKRSGICVCDPESYLDVKSGFCAPTSQTTQKPATTKPTDTPSVTMANKNTKKSKHGGINMTAVIIGAVFGGLLLIVVVVSVIVFLGRRRRQADYRGRHQLLSDHDDEDDTNVVI